MAPDVDGCYTQIELVSALAACGIGPGNFDTAAVQNLIDASIAAHDTGSIHGDTDTFVTFAINPDGSVTLVSADGGTQATVGTPTSDTDTNLTWVVNGDGSITFSSPVSGTDVTIDQDPDTDTNITFTQNGDGSWTFSSPLSGQSMTIPAQAITTDTILDMSQTATGATTFIDPNTNETIIIQSATQQFVEDAICTMIDNATPMPSGFNGPWYMLYQDPDTGLCGVYEAGIGPCTLRKVAHTPGDSTFDIATANGSTPLISMTFDQQIATSDCLFVRDTVNGDYQGTWTEVDVGDGTFRYTFSFQQGLNVGTIEYGIESCISGLNGEPPAGNTVGTCGTITVENNTQNVITNGDFETGLPGWNGVNVTMQLQAPGPQGGGDSYARVIVDGTGTPQFYWGGLNINDGDTLTLSFWHLGDGIDIRFVQASPFLALTGTQSVPATATWVQHTNLVFTASGSSTNARLQFAILSGSSAGDEWCLDDVELTIS